MKDREYLDAIRRWAVKYEKPIAIGAGLLVGYALLGSVLSCRVRVDETEKGLVAISEEIGREQDRIINELNPNLSSWDRPEMPIREAEEAVKKRRIENILNK
jgi:hypothetical protein